MDPLTLGAGAAGAWLWDQFGKDLLAKLGESSKGKWSKFQDKREWRQAAERYRLSLQRQYGTMRLLGKSEPVALEDIFTDMYVLDELTARQRFDIEVLKQKRETDGGLQWKNGAPECSLSNKERTYLFLESQAQAKQLINPS